MNAYELRQAIRKSRQAERAEDLSSAAEQLFAMARRSIEHIPFGQPILIGHHSERRHRRDLARHDRLMRRAIETRKRADELARVAETTSRAISSDDPDAPDKLRERVAKLERDQEAMKAANKVIRSRSGDVEKVAQLIAIGLTEAHSPAQGAARRDRGQGRRRAAGRHQRRGLHHPRGHRRQPGDDPVRRHPVAREARRTQVARLQMVPVARRLGAAVERLGSLVGPAHVRRADRLTDSIASEQGPG